MVFISIPSYFHAQGKISTTIVNLNCWEVNDNCMWIHTIDHLVHCNPDHSFTKNLEQRCVPNHGQRIETREMDLENMQKRVRLCLKNGFQISCSWFHLHLVPFHKCNQFWVSLFKHFFKLFFLGWIGRPSAGSTFGMVSFTCNVNRTCLRTVLENMLDPSRNKHPFVEIPGKLPNNPIIHKLIKQQNITPQ